mmetsp:Transcript_18431/g.51430  ORF Transcript_18431/g.51430 Transcript_18431/m.51430 type:complete len:109 (+) Transcript_18431:97-423(+)
MGDRGMIDTRQDQCTLLYAGELCKAQAARYCCQILHTKASRKHLSLSDSGDRLDCSWLHADCFETRHASRRDTDNVRRIPSSDGPVSAASMLCPLLCEARTNSNYRML